MKNALIGIVAVAGLAAAASAQQFTLAPGNLEFRIVADNTQVDGPADAVVKMALQVRYVGGDVRVASLGATRGRIDSNEATGRGTLTRSLVRLAPFGNMDFGSATQNGMTAGHRELFAGGGANGNLAVQNGGPGPFIGADGNVGFIGLLAFDNATTGVGRPDGSGDGLLISVGLNDSTDGGDDSFALEPGSGPEGSRWDSLYLFEYLVTDFSFRTITFDYQNIGSAAFPGVTEDTVQWFNSTLGGYSGSNASLGSVVSGASIVVGVPAPGALALLGLGGLVAGRRRRA